MIELSKDDLKCIEEFETVTGAAVIDCLIWTIIAFVILYIIWPWGPLEEKCVVKK